MTADLKKMIIGKISEMEEALRKYLAGTVEILTTDIDETLEQIIEERAGAVDMIGALHDELEKITDECTPEEKASIESAMKNGRASLGVSSELKEIRGAIVKMRSVYLEAAEKDKQAAARVDARVKELRSELEELSGSRKTLDYFSRNKLASSKGGSFDSTL